MASDSSAKNMNNKRSLSNMNKDKKFNRVISRIREMGPICEARKKVGSISTEPEKENEDEDDFDKQFRTQSWSEDDKCMWLSSGSVSPSSFFDDPRTPNFLEFSLDQCIVSLFSKSVNFSLFWGKPISFFDGSMVDPIDETCLVLEKACLDDEKILQEDLQEQEEVSCGSSLSWDSERTSGFGITLLDLDLEDSKWISDTYSEFDYLSSDFPSPSFKGNWGSEVQSCNSSVSSLTESKHENSLSSSSDCVSEAVDLEEFDADAPLFWPSNGKSEWGSEGKWDFFLMSPRKVEYKVRTQSKSFRIRLQNPKCKRRIVYGLGSKSSKILDLKHESGNKEVRRIRSMPSRLSKEAKNSMKIVPVDMEDDITELADENFVKEKFVGNCRNFLEGDFQSSEEDFSIEKLLGLDEFDGHEGVESEFNRDDFSLDSSP